MRAATAVHTLNNRSTPGAAGAQQANAAACLLCRAGAILCALPIAQVVEVMRLLPVERIARAPAYVRGLSIVRGAPVPVVDLGLIVAERPTPCTRLVVVRAATRTIALAVERVLGVTAIAADAFARLPPLLGDAAADTVTAISARDAALIVFLSAGRLVPDEVLAAIETDGTPQ